MSDTTIKTGTFPKKRLALFVRVDRPTLSGYFHIVGRVKSLAEDMKTFEHDRDANGMLILDLQAKAQGDKDSLDTYGWTYGYDTPGFVESYDAGKMAKTLDKVDKRMGKIAAEHGAVTDAWTYFYRFAKAVGCERILYFTVDYSLSYGIPDEIDWAPCNADGLAVLRRIHAVAIQRFGKKADVG